MSLGAFWYNTVVFCRVGVAHDNTQGQGLSFMLWNDDFHLWRFTRYLMHLIATWIGLTGTPSVRPLLSTAAHDKHA